MRFRVWIGFVLTIGLLLAQNGGDPWPASSLLDPAILAQALKAGKSPLVISVAFPVLYRQRHIPNAVNAGPGGKPEGIELLKQAVAGKAPDADIVLYCGCCPMTKCPNIRPAYQALKEAGFTHVRVLNIPTNMHEDWYSKGYPAEDGK